MQRGLPCILLNPSGQLQGPEAVVDNSVDNVLELSLAQPWSCLGFPFLSACQCLRLGAHLS